MSGVKSVEGKGFGDRLVEKPKERALIAAVGIIVTLGAILGFYLCFATNRWQWEPNSSPWRSLWDGQMYRVMERVAVSNKWLSFFPAAVGIGGVLLIAETGRAAEQAHVSKQAMTS